MKIKLPVLFFLLLTSLTVYSQGFNVKAKGIKTFNFYDKDGRNQATFFSTTPLEDITGTANEISGKIIFDVADFAKTLKGKIVVKVESINTGIDLRNKHLRSKNWLNAEKYPDIVFEIISVHDVKQINDNKLSFKVEGNFFLHGVTKIITADAESIYLDENVETRKRASGDLLGVKAKFYIKLSDFKIDNQIIGNKVADNIEVSVNIIGNSED